MQIPLKSRAAITGSTIIIALISSIVFTFTNGVPSVLFFVLISVLSGVLILTILGKNFAVKITMNLHSSLLFAFFSIVSIFLVILQLGHIYFEVLDAVLYLLVCVLALGLSLLCIFRFKRSFSYIEFLGLVYPLSIAFLAIFGTVILFLPSGFRGITESLAIAGLSITGLILKLREKKEDQSTREPLIFDNAILILLLNILILVVIFAALYPAIATLLRLDIAQNFLQALSFTKDTLGSFSNPSTLYPLFGIYQSSLIYVVGPNLITFQLVAITLNIFVILSFYTMASQYLKPYGNHTPAIATLFWSVFSGLGWLSFLSGKLSNPDASFIGLIGSANISSYGDITWQRLFFCLSMETSLCLVFAAMYILKRSDLSKIKQFSLLTLVITPIPLMHPYAIYLLLPVMLCFAVVCFNTNKQQIACSGYSLIVGSFASIFLGWVITMNGLTLTYSVLVPFTEYFIVGVIMLIISFIGKRPKLPIVTSNQYSLKRYNLALIPLLFLVACLLLWFTSPVPFSFTSLNILGYVPLFIYPVRFGVVGILAVIALYIFLAESKYRSRDLFILIAVTLLLLIFSVFIGTLQFYYVSTFTFNSNSLLSEILRATLVSFRAERMIKIIAIPLSIIASAALGKYVITKFKHQMFSLGRLLVVCCLIPVVLLSGVASTLLGFQYYSDATQANPLTDDSLQVISKLQSNLYNAGSNKATIISSQPSSYLTFTGATPIVTEAVAAWSSESPEFPLFTTRYSALTSTYFFIDKANDYKILAKYSGNYLEHLATTSPVLYENEGALINRINGSSIPVQNSSTALIIPYDTSTMSVKQPSHVVEPPQNTITSITYENNQYQYNGSQPIKFNVETSESGFNFNGKNSYIRINSAQKSYNQLMANFSYHPLDTNRNQIILSKFDYGNQSEKSWEIAQYKQAIVFKVSPDGKTERALFSPEILQSGVKYDVACMYDGISLRIFVNNTEVAILSYTSGLHDVNADIIVGAELNKNAPVGYAKMTLSSLSVLNKISRSTETLYNAYDVLSALNLNYTTVLSSDNALHYKTLILPYDDSATQELLQQITAAPNPKLNCVVIMNTNGNGPILDLFGSYTPQQSQVDQPKITPEPNVETLAQYAYKYSISPLVMTTTQGQLTLIYINLYPLIVNKQLLSSDLIQTISDAIKDYTEFCDDNTISSWFTDPALMFKTFAAEGEISVYSSSGAMLTDNQTTVTGDFSELLINSNSITVQRGYGFYTTVTAMNPSITLQGNTKTTTSLNGNVTFLLRTPEISVNGQIQFMSFYSLHPPMVYTDGRTASLSGDITMDICLSDEYTIALPYRFNSPITVNYEKPLMEFDEVEALVSLLPYMLLLTVLAVPIWYIRRLKHHKNGLPADPGN